MRKWSYPIIGNGDYVTSLLHVDDAASATVAALATGSGSFNVADDDPASASEWMPVYAKALGVRTPIHVPVFVARLAAGSSLTTWILSQRGISNAKIKRDLSWQPRYPTWRRGFSEALGPRP